MKDKKMKSNSKELKELLSNSLTHADNTPDSKAFKTSMYLIEYILGRDTNCWNKFIGIFENLTASEQIQVLLNANSYFRVFKNKGESR